MRALALWLGLAALLVQSVAPAYASLAVAGKGTSIVICTAHGFQTVQVDSDGKTVQGKSSAHLQDCCTDCQAAGGFVLPTPIRVPEPVSIVFATVSFWAALSIAPCFFSPYVTRAPPSGLSPSLA